MIDKPEWLHWLPLPGEKVEEIPPRVLPMSLELPALRTHGHFSRKKNKVNPPPESWRGLAEHPTELLREIERYLKHANTEKLPIRQRMRWTSHCLHYACPAIRRIYSEHHKGNAVPESHDRREGLLIATAVCAQLATGFKHILRHDYRLPDARYSYARARFRECAQYVLELIYTEQHLLALRYQKLPATAWLDCNRIFFAIRQCEDVHESRKSLRCLHVPLERKTSDQSVARRLGQTVSLQQIFLAIQLYGLMDTNSISSRNMHIVDAQLMKALPKLKAETDDGSGLLNGQVIVYGNQDRPPYFERQDEKAEAALARQHLLEAERFGTDGEQRIPVAVRIDLVPLEAALLQEHEALAQLFEARDDESSPRMAADSQDLARLLVIDAMCDKLHMKQRQHPRNYPLGKKVLYVYTGFLAVYELLTEAVVEEDERSLLVDEHQLRDALAERSALISSDADSSTAGQWLVMNNSAGGVHIKTRESQFTTSLFIGQLVAFAYTRDGLLSPIIGYVSRFMRSGQDIEVTLRVVSTRADATAVQSEFLSQNEMALPAIWTRLSDGREGVILHQSHRLSPGAAITLEVDGRRVSERIQAIELIQREFVLHILQHGGHFAVS